MFYEQNERIFELKSGEAAPILWNDEMYEEHGELKIIKLKVKSHNKNFSEKKINLTDYFYYIPKTNEVFLAIWYSRWNEYAKQDGTNFMLTANNKDGDKFEGKYTSKTGAFDIFEYHTLMKVEKISDIKQLKLQIHPINETADGTRLGKAIKSVIRLEVQKVGTPDDFK